ncbi:MAG TPA: fibronectin type III domain-containing protein [Lacipirellulaceae bacterium]|jgi:hypothetical protein|nr:fibronectin type III domain-containing protein [Lacipirellulaceae bacterium]
MSRTFAAVLLVCAFSFSFVSQSRAADEKAEDARPAPGLVAVGTQPKGGLSGKIVYTHGGHGYTAENQGDGHWSWQRGPGHQMIEDLGNYDQMALLVDYLFRAGATVVPQRPVGHQTNEVVLDNTDDEVKFVGDWENGTGPIYFGKAGSVPYRQAHTSKDETAYARYTPKIPDAGFYPVYAWTSSGGDRATDQLYRVHHLGGDTEVTVNHRRVGNGPVYLGTYYFEEGRDGWVDISNKSNSADSLVVADMVRFGNGMGDIDRGGGVSGFSREEEAGLYWVMWHVNHAQGIAESDYRVTDIDRQATISLSPRYAAFMNREEDGRLKDRVFVSFHSNAGEGKGRGVLGLLNGNNDPTTATPNQFLLAKSLAQKVNDDLVAQAGKFEHDWHDRKDKTTQDRDDIEFGEINNKYINNEFDATIVEVAFHDNKDDAQLLRDPKVRDAVARATYQGLLNYFRKVDNNETSAVRLPAAVTGLHVETTEAGSATVSWVEPETNSYLGDAATGYRVYGSTNGYGFDGGTTVDGEKSTSVTLKKLDPKQVYYFKVAATNEGGESPASEVVAVLPSGGAKKILLVNGFDWLDRTLDPKQTVDKKGSIVDRVRPRQSNSRDYVIQVATAVEAAAPGTPLESTSNESVISGAVDLAKYKIVIWTLGQESAKNRTLDETEQKKIEAFIAGGGNLLISGTEIGWDLDHEDHGREFYLKALKASFAADDAGTHEVTGVADGIFADLSKLKLDDGTQLYDASYPDVMKAEEGAKVALDYANDAGAAGLQVAGTGGRGNVVLLGFPYETIVPASDRTAVMKRVLDFFEKKK